MIRSLPAAVAALGWQATVLTPSYGTLHRLDGGERVGSITARFRGIEQQVDVWDVPGSNPAIRNIVFDHARFAPTEPGIVYHQDIDGGPYAIDAEKFAFFSAVGADWINSLSTAPMAVHLHDWHTGVLATLREFDPRFTLLRQTKTVFTIHNLSYQGQRPFAVGDSSFENWFPTLDCDRKRIADPEEANCFNPMAASIRLADSVNTVSPSYKEEILLPSNPATGFIGGEGLENDLNLANADRRLIGILNGCDYADAPAKPLGWQALLTVCRATLGVWADADDNRLHTLATQRVDEQPHRRPFHLLTSIGRLVEQKISLFLQETSSGRSALEDILLGLGDHGLLMLLGSGEQRYEEQLAAIAERHSNLIYFHGYSEALSDALYSSGDLFLMPSSFEPCGISQMIAMRYAQPCVVNAVGGLRDTVEDGVTGFVFDGDTPRQQATNFVARTADAVTMRRNNPLDWELVCKNARSVRFEWRASAEQYIRQLYEPH